MDILVSSNLERLLWHLSGGDSAHIQTLMKALGAEGFYEAGGDLKASLQNELCGGFAEMAVSHAAIAALWREEKYLIDTHTAVAYAVYLDYRAKTGDAAKTLIASTASPYKFAGSVAGAIGAVKGGSEFMTIETLEKATGLSVPACLRMLDKKPVLHDSVIEKTGIRSAVAEALL